MEVRNLAKVYPHLLLPEDQLILLPHGVCVAVDDSECNLENTTGTLLTADLDAVVVDDDLMFTNSASNGFERKDGEGFNTFIDSDIHNSLNPEEKTNLKESNVAKDDGIHMLPSSSNGEDYDSRPSELDAVPVQTESGEEMFKDKADRPAEDSADTSPKHEDNINSKHLSKSETLATSPAKLLRTLIILLLLVSFFRKIFY